MLVRQSGTVSTATPTPWSQKDAFPRPIKSGWTAHVSEDGRLFYCNHLTRSSSWLPPADTYDPNSSLPFGWEEAIDSMGIPYYINHVNQTTTKEPPPKDWAQEEPPPKPRHVTLLRDAKQGFGFVAGSEKPVIVRFVTEGGPSDGKLLPGDQILYINGEDVKQAPRDHAIQLVRSCSSQVSLTVCQPPLDNSARKSALLSVAKKARLKSNPSRVRFAEGVVVNGSPLFPPSTFASGLSSVPIMPNVLKVFLENGQTKSFKYDPCTTVQDVVDSLLQKLCITAHEHFCLMLEHVLGRRNKLSLLHPTQYLAKIAARPGSHNLRCLFRVAFVPTDPYDLLKRDPVAFEYLYMQCCNDVVQERFAPELKYDIALRLASLHIQQHAISNNMAGKLSVKNIEQEFGFERFVPVSLMESMKRKELRKLIGHFMKSNTSGANQGPLTGLQAKLHYLHIIGDLPSYGAKCFSTSIRDSNTETVILVSPKFGISQITGLRNSIPVLLAEIQHMTYITVCQLDELTKQVDIHLTMPEAQVLSLSVEERDAEELVLVLKGYYQLMAGTELPIDCSPDSMSSDETTEPHLSVPPYAGIHHVRPESWNYAVACNKYQLVNLSVPPTYIPLSQSNTEGLHGKTVDSNMNSMTNNANNSLNVLPNGKVDSYFHELGALNPMDALHCDLAESNSEEARRRMSDMQRLVLASQQYLSEQTSTYEPLKEPTQEESDSEGSSHMSSLLEAEDRVSGGGELKHSDSLLLLTQGHKLLAEEMSDVVRNLEISGDTEPSESDTDSLSTPTSSPSHRPPRENGACFRPASLLKPSDSSFGLHSPDNVLPAGCRPSDIEIRELLLRLQQDSSLPYHFAEGTLYLDPDIIDLTMIPPPITPDNEALHSMLNAPSSPPTPFADHATFEQQLLELMNNSKNNSNEWDQNMLEQLMDSSNNLDLDAFLASVVVPAPCQLGVELTPEEVSAFIIPPPPPTSMPPPLHNSVDNSNYYKSLDYGLTLRFSCESNFPDHAPFLSPRLNNYCINRQTTASRISMMQAEERVRELSERLLSLAEQCRGCIERGGGARQDVAQCRVTQSKLCAEARSLVTSSKLLVQAATAKDRTTCLEAPLTACLNALCCITELAEELSYNTDSPSHTMALILRSREVSECLGSTLRALNSTASAQVLQKCAEDLVTALSALLRGLKVFTS